ncbi:MAG: serine/threonine-protein kinase [Cyanobacteriota bacterium]|nr:serine/threonine-protein kinase [Cyanobacteriota bacterium]
MLSEAINIFPDFSNYGYQVTRELGHNRAGGRVTYLATEVNTGKSVVVKQFQFAQTSTNWTEYQAYEREINVLKELDSPYVPRYLDSFQTPTGFCMVQEYKKAPSLATLNRLSPHQSKQIAIAVLEILKYLQTRIPPVIHRDLKPENILVGDRGKVYLVDFGFARMGGGEVAASSVVKGTLGFMPPEQMFNRQITIASDLYSLGATIICLLLEIPSTEIGSLMDDAGRLHFRSRLPQLSDGFLDWLEKMVEPNYKKRYPSAKAALDDLVSLEVLRPKKKSWIPMAVCVAGAGILLGTAFWVSRFFTPEPEPSSIEPKESDRYQVTFTNELANPRSEIVAMEAIPLNNNAYFYLIADSVEEKMYEGRCRIFDPSGELKYDGDFPLIPVNSRLETWCRYQLSSPEDRPGEWTFEFYLDGQPVVWETLEVLPKED